MDLSAPQNSRLQRQLLLSETLKKMTKFLLAVLITVVLCAFVLGRVSAITPVGPLISSVEDAWSIGDANTALVHFDHYLDLTCDTCAEHFNSITKKLVGYYFNNSSSKADPRVRITVHLMQLPIHIASFYCSQSFIVVNKFSQHNSNIAFKFLDSIWTNQSPVLNHNVNTLNQQEIFTVIFNNYVRPLGLNGLTNLSQFLNEMSKQDAIMRTMSLFKLATSRGVYGTPSFFVNNAPIFNGVDFNASDWINLFNTVISAN